jgi:hypothetical protein
MARWLNGQPRQKDLTSDQMRFWGYYSAVLSLGALALMIYRLLTGKP